jgi:hypothetical protein
MSIASVWRAPVAVSKKLTRLQQHTRARHLPTFPMSFALLDTSNHGNKLGPKLGGIMCTHLSCYLSACILVLIIVVY